MATKPVSRRDFFRLGALAGGTAALAACGGTPAAPVEQGAAATAAPGSAPVVAATAAPAAEVAAATAAPAAAGADTLTISLLNENWGDIYNNLMVVIGDDFSKANPSIKLDWNFDPDWTTKLTTQLAANTPPDATIMRPGQLATLARKGALMDLSSFVQETGLKREDFVVPIYDSSTYDGKLYAIPGGADYIAMYYSKDVLKAADLDPEKPPTTYDDLIAQSKQILQKDSNGDIQRIGYIPQASHLVNWTYIFGGKFYDAASQKITANDPANVAFLEKLVDYVKLLDIDKLTAFNQRPGTFEAGNPFATKQSAFVFDGFWTYEAFDQHAPDIDYAVTFWPTVKGTPEERKNYAISGWMYTIPTGSKNADAAWKFIRYAFIDQAAKMGVLTLNGPCVKSALPVWETGVKEKMGAKNRLAPHMNIFSETGAAATNFFPLIPVQSFYSDELNRVYDLVIRGQQTPQAALDEVTKNVQAELDKVSK
ncbi:MAG: extracellular solute-binding protein [Chloroflexota bacterium]|nr:extracellular solute-binding protein [Chloroflexota bacterium]